MNKYIFISLYLPEYVLRKIINIGRQISWNDIYSYGYISITSRCAWDVHCGWRIILSDFVYLHYNHSLLFTQKTFRDLRHNVPLKRLILPLYSVFYTFLWHILFHVSSCITKTRNIKFFTNLVCFLRISSFKHNSSNFCLLFTIPYYKEKKKFNFLIIVNKCLYLFITVSYMEYFLSR